MQPVQEKTGSKFEHTASILEAFERGGYTVIRLIRSGVNLELSIEKILEVAEESIKDAVKRGSK